MSQNTPASQHICLLAWRFKIGFLVRWKEVEQHLVAALVWVAVAVAVMVVAVDGTRSCLSLLQNRMII